MVQVILAAILTLMPAPSPKWHESPDEFRARMTLISEAVDTAVTEIALPAERRPLAMAEIVQFWGESRFSPLVQSGEHTGDGGKALCLGQNHQGSLSKEEWRSLVGLDLESTTRCALVTANRLKRARDYCRSWPEAFVIFGTGRTCRASESKWKNIFLDRGRKWAKLTDGSS